MQRSLAIGRRFTFRSSQDRAVSRYPSYFCRYKHDRQKKPWKKHANREGPSALQQPHLQYADALKGPVKNETWPPAKVLTTSNKDETQSNLVEAA